MAFGGLFLLQDFSQVHLRLSVSESERERTDGRHIFNFSYRKRLGALANPSPHATQPRRSTLRSRCWRRTSPEEKRYTRKGAAHYYLSSFWSPASGSASLPGYHYSFFLFVVFQAEMLRDWVAFEWRYGVCHEWHRSLGRVELLITS